MFTNPYDNLIIDNFYMWHGHDYFIMFEYLFL